MAPGQTFLPASSAAGPRPAAPPCAPTRMAFGKSWLWTCHVFTAIDLLSNARYACINLQKFVLSCTHQRHQFPLLSVC